MSDPSKQISHRRIPPLPGNSSSHTWSCASARKAPSETSNTHHDNQHHPLASIEDGLSPELVKTYLRCNPELLEEQVMDLISLDDLEELLRRKKTFKRSSSLMLNTFNKAPILQDQYIETNISTMQRNIISQLERCGNTSCGSLPILYELLHVIGLAVKADGCSMYVPRCDGNELHLYIPPDDNGPSIFRMSGLVGYNTTVASHVAMCKEAVLVTDIIEDDRFPRGIGIEDPMIQSVLCLPVTLPTDDLLCIMEFTRTFEKHAFTEKEYQTAAANLTWIGATLHEFQVNKTLRAQTELHDFLLEVSKVIFDDIIAMDSLVKKIMTYTKKLVNADRCALFMYDKENEELFADLFDEGKEEDGLPVFTKMDTVRFPVTKGIAGHVARTAEIINIKDAYSDKRFNREVDRQTGYTTRNILCMPILSKGDVLGVVQMINKMSGEPFSTADELSFKAFSVFCSLALHYSKIYTDIQLKTAQFKVTLEQMSFHIMSPKEEVDKLTRRPLPDQKLVPPDLDDFFFYGPWNHSHMLPELYMQMIHDLLGPHAFNMGKLCQFVLTLRKNYRPVAYHNWNHGWNVTHSMFCMLSALKKRNLFSTLRMKALMIGSLAHDVDHRGYNNTFFVKLNDPLAILYPTSVMEKHHYAHTVTILQLENHDIFSSLSTAEYKEALEYIRGAIIATDLALFFPNQKHVSKLLLSGSFDINNLEHQRLATEIMMTAADISHMAKNWNYHVNQVRDLYVEFYEQGDKEKMQGLTPLPMMDRNNKKNLPKEQVGFIQFVCLPCYQTLYEVFPETKPLLEGARDNLYHWQRVLEGKSTGLWEPNKSVPSEDKQEDSKH